MSVNQLTMQALRCSDFSATHCLPLGAEEQTAKYMHSSAQVLLDKYEGSLYKLREAAKEKPDAERKKIQEIKGLAKVHLAK